MEYENITKDKNAIIYKRMSVGEIQHTVFKEGDLPPCFFPDQPQFDTIVSIPRKRKAGEQASEIFDNKIIKGYVNEPKGIKQLLIERGLWLKGMRGSQDNKLRAKLLAAGKDLLDPTLDGNRVLSECEDFVKEKGALQEIIELRGQYSNPLS